MLSLKNDIFEKIKIIHKDITNLKVDAIVNAANNSLSGGGGVDGAIHKAAGPNLLQACKKTGGCPTGEARITEGYNLFASYVIHTVGPVYKKKNNNEQLLTLCYNNCLSLAQEYQIKTIAFPAISCGIYGYPIDKACEIALNTCLAFIEKNDFIHQIIFSLFSSKYKFIYEKHFNNKISGDRPSYIKA